MHPTTVAVDLAKNVFELAVADVHWHVVARHRFTRRQFERFLASPPACHIVMEACGTAHHWGRVAFGHGHQVTLLPAQYVRPYARGNKTDRTDAEALLEAVRSGRLVPVAVKTVAQQELLALHAPRRTTSWESGIWWIWRPTRPIYRRTESTWQSGERKRGSPEPFSHAGTDQMSARLSFRSTDGHFGSRCEHPGKTIR